MGFIKYQVGDVVQMKKPHPCGSQNWEIKRTGVDFVTVCEGCGHQVMIPRPKFEKNVKKDSIQKRSNRRIKYDS